MLQSSSKYAVRAIDYLVRNSLAKRKLLVSEIAAATGVPQPYLSKLLRKLTTHGYVSSTKGPGGGYFITDQQLDNSVLDIIIATEGKDRMRMCALNFENCSDENPCGIHHLIAEEKNALRNAYQNIKLSDLKS